MIPLDRKQFPAKLFWIDKWLILAIGHFFRIIASYSSDTDEQPTNVHQILNRCFVNQSTTMISSFGLFSQFIHSLPSLNSNEDVRIFFIECFLLSPNLSESYIKLLQRRLSLINVLLIILYESMNKKSKIKELILKFFESFEKKSLEFQNYCEKRFNLKNTIKSMTQQIEIDIE
ncbi:hypothetical protein SNEBB_007966 [Seison nebaliae]|nr:hypothetical protein SNEBB_007966 [Seison nebaliae]